MKPALRNAVAVALLSLGLTLLAVGCDSAFGKFESPLDSKSPTYVGYPTVESPDEIAAAKPADLSDGANVKLTVTAVTGATSYEAQVATTDAFASADILVGPTQTSNIFTVAVGGLKTGTLYWHARAQKGGVWGKWSDTATFTLASIVASTTTTVAGATTTTTIVTSSGIVMVDIPAGTFNNGTSDVTLSAFKMGKYEVTQSQYQAVMGVNPSSFTTNADAANCPVETVTWYDAVEFCNLLSVKEGLQSVYGITGRNPSAGYPVVGATVTMDLTKSGYRLPSEGQWEFAARGGTFSGGYTYSGSNTIEAVAWYQGNSLGKTHVVGTKTGNELGLFDMSGNVWEWCWDIYAPYQIGPQIDPISSSFGSVRIDRNGSWSNNANDCAVTSRFQSTPDLHDSHGGFRIAAPAENAAVTGITLDKSTLSLTAGGLTGTLVATVAPSAIQNKSALWFTSDATVATVSAAGVVTPLKAGTATITARSAADVSKSATCTVMVAAATADMAMIKIPGGTFNNGSATVILSAFEMSKYEITQSQYQTVTGINPSYYSTNTDAATCPVEQVTWYDAVEFCNKLSAREGLASVYTISGRSPASGYPITSATVTANFTMDGYRLPTEAQWEYAARSGTTSTYYWGEAADAATIGPKAWYAPNASGKTNAVGQKTANAYGLYDMAGNAWEWCWDWFGTYSGTTQADPTGPSTGTDRARRGGSYMDTASFLQSANRISYNPSGRYDNIGFRVVRLDAAAAVVPTDLAATAGTAQVTLSWTASFNATSYNVYYKSGSATATTSDTKADPAMISGTTATITGLTGGTQYGFVVTAQKGTVESPASVPASATPATPTGGSSFTLSGGLLGDYTVTFTATATPAIAAPDSGGAYYAYTVPQASLPLTISVMSTPAASSFQWLLDGTTQASTASSVTFNSLPVQIHYLTLLLKSGTDPNRSATIILKATN